MRRILYHYPLSPFSRKIRLQLAEKGLEFELQLENFWERRRKFLELNPAAQVPVLVEDADSHNPKLFAYSTAISEYLEEKYTEKNLLGTAHEQRAEVRRLTGWFNSKLYYEVTKYLLDEKIFKTLRKQGEPNSTFIRAAKTNITDHLDYISFLLRERSWLGGEKFSLADITAASQISVLDYLGEVPWEKHENVKHWYILIKSRPSFKPLLEDYILGFEPGKNYRMLDF